MLCVVPQVAVETVLVATLIRPRAFVCSDSRIDDCARGDCGGGRQGCVFVIGRIDLEQILGAAGFGGIAKTDAVARLEGDDGR